MCYSDGRCDGIRSIGGPCISVRGSFILEEMSRLRFSLVYMLRPVPPELRTGQMQYMKRVGIIKNKAFSKEGPKVSGDGKEHGDRDQIQQEQDEVRSQTEAKLVDFTSHDSLGRLIDVQQEKLEIAGQEVPSFP